MLPGILISHRDPLLRGQEGLGKTTAVARCLPELSRHLTRVALDAIPINDGFRRSGTAAALCVCVLLVLSRRGKGTRIQQIGSRNHPCPATPDPRPRLVFGLGAEGARLDLVLVLGARPRLGIDGDQQPVATLGHPVLQEGDDLIALHWAVDWMFRACAARSKARPCSARITSQLSPVLKFFPNTSA
jgi:hypothetical protein